jgi:hypothetical protein
MLRCANDNDTHCPRGPLTARRACPPDVTSRASPTAGSPAPSRLSRPSLPGDATAVVDRLKGSRIHHLKELRPGSRGRSEIRIIFAFDPTRSALLLLGGDKAGNWERWYRDNVPVAERLYLDYTTEGEQ